MSKNRILTICIFLTVATLVAFWRLNYCAFIALDDGLYITKNTHIMNGITWEAVRWAFTAGYAGNWHPVTWMSLMADVQLFGLNPHRLHLTNLLFHVANSLLLFFVLYRMTKAPWKCAFIAALFALHPLHVESVAWITERKDVLSTFFWMLTMGAYILYVDHPRLKYYLAVLIFFVLGLMAKPMLVTLPFVLLLLDFWPLKRFEKQESAQEIHTEVKKPVSANRRKGKSSRKYTVQTTWGEGKPADHKYQWALIRPLLREKLPLFALAGLSSIVTFIAQQKGGAVESMEAFPLGVRIGNTFVSYIVYIGKMIWPANLAVLYPHPGPSPLWQSAGGALVVVAMTAICTMTAKRFPYLAVGWFWFVGTLVPVIGIVQIGGQGWADRYTYIPLIGLFIMVAWGVPEFLKSWRHRKEAFVVSSALILSSLSIVTWIQVGYWRTSFTLFDHTLEATTNNYYIHCCRGAAYANLGNDTKAISDFNKAIEINPEYVDAYSFRAISYGALGSQNQAISDYDKVLEVNPEDAATYNNRGVAYAKLGNNSRAISDYDRAIEIAPGNAEFYNDRGIAQEAIGNPGKAISDYDRAIAIDPRNARAYNNRGLAHRSLGNDRHAIADFDRAIEIDPKYPDAYNNRGVAYAKLGNNTQAISDFNEAIEIDPRDASAFYNRGASHHKLGHDDQAIDDLKTAAELGSKEAQDLLRSQGVNW